MYTKPITYTDYNGVERTENFMFHMNKAEILEMDLTTTGGLTALMQRAVEAKDVPTLTSIFKDLILRSYGVKSDDGRRFIKTPELSAEFSQTEAYSVLFMELATDDKAAAAFVNGIIPADLAKKVEEMRASGELPVKA